MEMPIKSLREYQVRLVTDVCRTDGDVLIEQPTGSGKTLQIVTLVAMHLGRRFSHAVISAPQEQIEQGFVERDYGTIAFPSCHGAAQPALAAPRKLIHGARKSGLGSVKQIAAYLRQPGQLDYALACTHAAVNMLTSEQLPGNLAGKALFIDEAHHASADGLSQIVTLWRERGGQVLFFTATPYRGDGRPVKLDGMRTFRRSLAEHMAEGFAPRHLDSEIEALGQAGEVITPAIWTGEEAPPDIEKFVSAICRRWLDDNKPKMIVRVPPMREGKSGQMVERLTQALTQNGARVLDATGTSAVDKQRFLDALKAEQRQTFATSTFDVMIGIQRVLEGTDWPLCSAVYNIGMPGSLNTVVQFLGRAMRLKGKDYPVKQRDRAKLVFFVPCGGGDALADLSIHHSRHALLTCCFLADHEVGQEWIVTQEVRRGIEAGLGSPADNPAAADAENEADKALEPDIRAEVELAIASAREQIVSNGREPTLCEVLELTAKTRPDLPETAIQRLATEILAAPTTNAGTAAREAIREEIAKRLRIDPRVKQAMTDAFAVVLEEFRDATLKDSAVLESLGRQVHGVTGGQMRIFAERLRQAVPRPLTEEQILAWADVHYEAMEDWPNQASGLLQDAPDENWANLNQLLERGLRGLPGGSSIAQLLEKHRGVPNANCPPPLTEQQILAWADAHFERTGEWPMRETGEILESPVDTWSGINQALRKGLRGLSAGSSLPRLLAQHRDVPNVAAPEPLSLEQILAWADAHFERNNNWPGQKSGPIQEAPGETWRAIEAALRSGSRGLPGGSSLAQFLGKERDAPNVANRPSLTEERILGWADVHFQETGNWPQVLSGPVIGVANEDWRNIQAALVNGGRGLPGKSSLAQLLVEKRGVRITGRPGPLTIEQILAWADVFHKHNNERWPCQDSGEVENAPGETWGNIDQALAKGLRTLPGGSSLAQVLAETRKVRNPKRPPNLTIQQIIAWADHFRQQNGRWPSQNSGEVERAPGEKWRNIDQALAKGLRGLQGGSSLARLIKENRKATNNY